MKRNDTTERGQAVIEMALIMPFLLMFILFLIDLALLGFAYVSVTNAVREGARCGAVGATNDAIIARVQNTSGPVDVGSPSVTRDPEIGGDITVSVDAEYDWITPVGLVPGLSGSLNFTRSAVMRMETAPPYTGTCGGGG